MPPPDSMPDAPWLRPQFSASNVVALMTTREGGVSEAPFDSLNMRTEVGDDPLAVSANRERVGRALGLRLVPMQQVHGARVVDVSAAAAPGNAGPAPQADASFSRQPGLACEIQVADCLPVLLADRRGRVVGGAHAGWRGLASGVVEATIGAMGDAAGVRPGDLEAWLGPCIGPRRFEVGADVLQAFGVTAERPGERFVPAPAVAGQPKWLADLAGLARDRLSALGVGRVSGNDSGPDWCTVENRSRFFSFRRDKVTGRMSACIGLSRGV